MSLWGCGFCWVSLCFSAFVAWCLSSIYPGHSNASLCVCLFVCECACECACGVHIGSTPVSVLAACMISRMFVQCVCVRECRYARTFACGCLCVLGCLMLRVCIHPCGYNVEEPWNTRSSAIDAGSGPKPATWRTCRAGGAGSECTTALGHRLGA